MNTPTATMHKTASPETTPIPAAAPVERPEDEDTAIVEFWSLTEGVAVVCDVKDELDVEVEVAEVVEAIEKLVVGLANSHRVSIRV